MVDGVASDGFIDFAGRCLAFTVSSCAMSDDEIRPGEGSQVTEVTDEHAGVVRRRFCWSWSVLCSSRPAIPVSRGRGRRNVAAFNACWS